MSHSEILLQGGSVLVHGNDDHVTAIKAEILIKGSIITEIAPSFQPTSITQVVDCRDKSIAPGFIDTSPRMANTSQRAACKSSAVRLFS